MLHADINCFKCRSAVRHASNLCFGPLFQTILLNYFELLTFPHNYTMIQQTKKPVLPVTADHTYCKVLSAEPDVDDQENKALVHDDKSSPKKQHSMELKRLLLFGPDKDRRSLWPAALNSSNPITNFPGIDDELKSLKDIAVIKLDHVFPPETPPIRRKKGA